MMKKLFVTLALVIFLSPVAVAKATIYTLNFDGLGQNEQILNFYNGGSGSSGNASGPNYGVTFSSSALALNYGNYRNNPSSQGIMYFLYSNSTIMNVPTGFENTLSFYYSAFEPGSVSIYAGTGGTGTRLANLNLSENVTRTADLWRFMTMNFTGTAQSVLFSGIGNEIGFDNISFDPPGFTSTPPGFTGGPSGFTTVTPEPSTLLLFGSGLIALFLAGLIRRVKA